jgi:tRNA modification GTPase
MLQICRALCHNTKRLSSRYAYVHTLYDPSDASNILDPQAVVIRLNKPTTQTGEDMLELHVHGGNATVKAVLQGITKVKSQHKIRYAEAGEFTRRAFANWKLDLPQVEALSDQLSAETEQQRRAAVRGSSYHLRATYTDWCKQLLNARGEMEALIDFSEDQHFDESPKQLLDGITKKVKAMRTAITLHQDASSRGELLRRGIRISLLGPPNAGKSSLLNQIVGREASIVSHEPGTTRDVVEVSLDLKGYLCTFADTAGLRTQGSESTASSEVVNTPIGAVELEGIRRAKANASDSDLVIVLASVEESSSLPGTFEIKYDAESLNLAARRTSLVVINKWDLLKSPEQRDQLMKSFKETLKPIGLATFINAISCHEAESSGGENGHVDKVVKDIVSKFRSMTELPPELQDLVGVTERSRQLLAKATESLGAYLDEASWEHIEPDIVIAAEHLRDAAQSLARIVGKNSSGDVEEVLSVVFEKSVYSVPVPWKSN